MNENVDIGKIVGGDGGLMIVDESRLQNNPNLS